VKARGAALPGWPAAGVAFAAGAMAALGHAPLGLWPLTILGLAVLMNRVAAAGRGAGWLGLAGGMGYGAVALSWIVEPFLVWPEIYGWMAPFALFFMALGMGAFWGLAGFAAQRIGFAQTTFGFALTLTLAEHLRGHILTGFPWAMPGHVWIATPVAQMGAFVGPTGLTLLLLLIAAALASLRAAWVGWALAVAAGLWGVGLVILAATMPADRDATLRLVQPNAEQRLKWDPDQARLYFDRLLDASAEMPLVDLVIWPETALPYVLERHPELPLMIAKAAGGAQVALGAQREDGSRFWNSLTLVSPEGQIGDSYDKSHLVPFGEYIPLGDLAYRWFGIRAFAAQEGAGYTAGTGPKLLDFGPKIGRALPLICYEVLFPEEVNAAPERPDWLLQVTNDAWFGVLSGPFQHAGQARMRAIEQGLPLVRVANTGVTAVYDARGRLRADLPFGQEGHLDQTLPGALPATVYSRFGDGPALLLLVGLGLLLLRKRVQSIA
jgi:apolipoprotein N-acyltransferase